MVRVLTREVLLAGLCLVVISAAVFGALDLVRHQDWFATASHASSVGAAPDHLTAHDLPLYWNPRVEDAQLRTERDLRALGDGRHRATAQQRLRRRGTAGLPYVLTALGTLPPAARTAALEVLASLAPALTGGDRAPAAESEALRYWERFYALRALDFRPGFALRRAQRIVSHPSPNASEQLARLGTYALPAIFKVLSTNDAGARVRLTSALADITGIGLRVPAGAGPQELTRVVEAWRALWFADHLEYERLSDWQRALGHVSETRYGRWVARALRGRFGTSAVTRRPVALELRERLPASALVAGLGGLLAVAFVVAFGGGAALRRRPLRTKLLDLTGALVPGLVALTAGFAILLELCAAPGPAGPLLVATLEHWVRLAFATVLTAVSAAFWLRRRRMRLTLHLVRMEAESWATESLSPRARQVLRHGVRIGLASLLAPLGLVAPGVLLASLAIEPLSGLHGMGTLTVRALLSLDAPWLVVTTLSVVPIALGRRWARRVLAWALGESRERVELAAAAVNSLPPPAAAESS